MPDINPWDIVSWVGALSVTLIIVVLTVRMVINLSKPSKERPTSILSGRSKR